MCACSKEKVGEERRSMVNVRVVISPLEVDSIELRWGGRVSSYRGEAPLGSSYCIIIDLYHKPDSIPPLRCINQ